MPDSKQFKSILILSFSGQILLIISCTKLSDAFIEYLASLDIYLVKIASASLATTEEKNKNYYFYFKNYFNSNYTFILIYLTITFAIIIIIMIIT